MQGTGLGKAMNLDSRIKTDPLTNRDPADWFYAISWTRSDLPDHTSSDPGGGGCGGREGRGGWLIFEDEAGLLARLLARLKERGEPVVTVRAAETFARLGERRYAIDAARADDYQKLLGELIKLDGLPRWVVHAWSVTSDEVERNTGFQRTQERGFESLLYLAQALGSHDLTEGILLGVLTEGVCEITGNEPLRPETATILGPCRVIPQENPQIRCRAIDCLAADGEEVIDGILAEMTADTDDGVVAYRAGKRLVRGIKQVSLAPPKKACPPLRERGVYLITGGLGGLGLAIAEHLARSVRARLVLVGRLGLPPREEWPNSTDDRLRRRIKRVEAIEAAGGEVMVAAADVAQPQRLKAVVQAATARFGPINGVVHAAGVAGAGLIQLKSVAEARRVLEPKVGGARSLQEVFSDTALDFLVLFSSTTALVGGLGQVDSCAANCFLDLFARDFGKRREMVAISINWGPWQWDDRQAALTATVPRMQAHLAQVRQKTGISFAEGAAAFATVLASPLSQVIVSPQDPNKVIQEHARGVPWADAAGADEATHGRPPIPTPFVAPSGLLPPVSLIDAPTVKQLAERLDDTDLHDTPGRAVQLQEGSNAPPLFLLPTAGDQVLCFRELVSLLGEDLPCYGLEAPGLDGITESADRMEDLAGILVQSMRRAQPAGPYHLCGHCDGGMIAFEMARQLAKQGEQVAFLALLNTTVPQPKTPGSHDGRQTAAGGGQIDWPLATESARRPAAHSNASGAARVADVIEQVHEAGHEALRNYEPKPYPGRLVLFQATAEPGWGKMVADYGWAPLIRGGLEIQTLDCRHLQMLTPPYVDELAEKMGACLTEALARHVNEPTHEKGPTHD